MTKLLYVTPRTARHETSFLDDFSRSVEELGYARTSNPAEADLSIVWGWDRLICQQPTIFVEMGWIPRWHYQVSPRGLNYRSHLAQMTDAPVAKFDLGQAHDWLWKHRSLRPPEHVFRYADPTGMPFDFGYDFVLVPLQVDGDANLRPTQDMPMQEFVDLVTVMNPPYPVVFRGHPATIAKHGHLNVGRPADRLFINPDVTVHQMLKSLRCLGVIALNSNVVHDAMVWNKTIVTLAPGPWPHDLFPHEFMKSPDPFSYYKNTVEEPRLRYIHRLRSVQWKLSEAQDVGRVKKMVEMAYEEVQR